MSGNLFGERKAGDAFGGLFAKSSVIDNDSLVKEKQQKQRQSKKDQKRSQAEEKQEEDNAEDDESMDVDEEEQQAENKEPKKASGESTDLEDKYMSKLVSSDEEDEEDEEEESDNEEEKTSEKEDESTEEAETNLEAKVIDLKQKEFGDAEKTVFIGNVPSSVMANKKNIKEFKRFINESLNAPENESLIQSIRFRSLHSQTNAPKKVAYISKEVNMDATMTSYVVFKTKETSLKAVKLNGKVYKEHHLRFDHLTHPAKKDNKKSVFVGNVLFEETEERLWRYFNKVLKDDSAVDNVRIVRDSKTSFGKGFAIVQFTDTNFVSKALLFDGKKMGNRELRVTRCKKPQRNSTSVRAKTAVLSERQKTLMGRAKVLPKADRHSVGQIIEGERAKFGSKAGIKKPRHKKRITKRSQQFKEGK